MAVFESKKEETKEYLALLGKDDNLVAFVQPVKGVSLELLAEKLTEKGLNVEIRQPKGDVLDIEL